MPRLDQRSEIRINDQRKHSRSYRFLKAAVIAAILFAIGASLGYCSEPNTENWSKDIHHAIQSSRTHKKTIMLLFTRSDTCIYCRKLENEVINTPAFCEWSKDLVKFKVDFSEDANRPVETVKLNIVLKKKFADLVTSYPTVLFVNSQGSVLAKTGYIPGGSKNWIEQATQLLK